jgi:glycine cleavage system T protein (aminomethyltransferase)
MLKLSPLDAHHRALGAKMGEFAGWDMPISYPAGTVAEHTAVRERAGIFDVSHLGKLLVSGSGAAEFLDSQLTNHMADLQVGRARYTLICNDDAGIVDDLIVYAIGQDEMLVVPNASNRDVVFERLASAAPANLKVEILEWSTLAVQGPRSREIVAALYPASKSLGYMRVARDEDTVVSRSGYTGEFGFEVFTTDAAAPDAWERLLAGVRDAGGEPAGLAARDTLRLEMGYPLHGNDIDPQTTPAEAGLMWAVSLKGREFPGARAIATRAPAKKLVGLRMTDRLIPRHGHEVRSEGRSIGTVTSGTFSPTLRIGVALAYVEPATATEGDVVEVDVRGKVGRAQVVRPPFVSSSPK